MLVRKLHPWRINPKKAREIQGSLASRVIKKGRLPSVKYVAGADISAEKGSKMAYAGVVVLRFPGLELVEQQGKMLKLSFPYIPGLLAFREAPPLLRVIKQLRYKPDIFLFDGQGIAHPRRIGIASHMGLLLDKPSIGCAKSRLFGHYKEPGLKRGSFSYLYDAHKRIVGAVVRTRTDVRPVFVSIGHRIDLMTAIRFVMACTSRYRVPDPIREAHFFVNHLRQAQSKIICRSRLVKSAS
jgi:deoxyribonuclease V